MAYLNKDNKFSPINNTMGDTLYKAVKVKNPLILTDEGQMDFDLKTTVEDKR